jgi:hypothetical protein
VTGKAIAAQACLTMMRSDQWPSESTTPTLLLQH